MDLFRYVFDRLSEAGRPDAAARACIYDQCRAEIAARHAGQPSHDKTLANLEKVIRRQEMQALYEESLERDAEERPKQT
ncbi:MAG: hypothetical protein R3D68_20525 [Hyphomicrobiaceae bacterium]